jgi:glutathione synthase/RimK-type ligase-like ATP-grasp enzyme
MKRIRVYPYKMESKSAKALADAFNAKRIRGAGAYAPGKDDLIINWGNSEEPKWNPGQVKRYLNPHFAVDCAASKIASYRAFEEKNVRTIEWTCKRDVAAQWLREGFIVLLRKQDRAHAGAGIVVVNPNGEGGIDQAVHTLQLNRAAFFAKYQTHTGEYRVHVMNGKVIDFVKKKKMSPDKMQEAGYQYNQYVRNHDHGWVFARENVELPDAVAEQAILAANALGLDFGAVDVIQSNKFGVFVLEVNTAPGLEGTTLERYVAGFRDNYGI